MEFAIVSPPDEEVRQAAEERHTRLTKPLGALGRLEELGTWLAACQGQCPPRPLQRPRVVVFAGDHGVAAKGVSAYPSEVTAQMVANFQAGGAAINVLAGVAGATVRVVDMSVAVDTSAGGHKVRSSSGSIDSEDALTEAEVSAALAAGKAIADEEVDAGADLLVAGDMGIGNTTPAAVLIAAITGSEPVAVVGRGTGIDDRTWMRKTAAIRDALRRAKPVTADPVALLRTTAGADIAAMAAFLAQAAVRRTPVVLDGVVSGAAALLAEELAPGARAWWVAGHRSTEPAHTLVLDQLDLKPLLELGMRLGEGSGATAAIPLLTMASQVLTDMATFEDAGVSGPAEDKPAPPTPANAELAPAEPPATEPTAAEPDAIPATTTESTGTQATAEPATAEPPAAEAGTQPTITEPSTAQTAATEPAAAEPGAISAATTESTGTQATAEPASTEADTQPTIAEPSTTQTTATEPATTQANTQPAAAAQAGTQPATAKPAAATKQASAQPTAAQPSTTEPTPTPQPSSDQAAARPTTEPTATQASGAHPADGPATPEERLPTESE